MASDTSWREIATELYAVLLKAPDEWLEMTPEAYHAFRSYELACQATMGSGA